MFAAIRRSIAAVPDGATILDVPCGGGVAFRALRPTQRVRYVAVDLDQEMLARARCRADDLHLDQIELVAGHMRELPFAAAIADLCLSVSGLHMIPDPERAVADMGRCVKPGGEIAGTTFLADGGLRQTPVFGLGSRTGHVAPTATAGDLERWLADAGFEAVEVQPRRGFAHFRGRKEQAAAAD